MLRWTLLGEFYSIFILIILFVRCYFFERNGVQNGRPKLFLSCLPLSMGLILLNILCVYILYNPTLIPRWCSIFLNTLYFQMAMCLCSLFAFLLFDVMLQHVYDKHCIRRAIIMLSTITSISAIILIVNLFTGIIFCIDEAGIYSRGPYNKVFYLLVVIELVFLCICYVRNHASIGASMFYVMRCLPPIILLLCILQVAFPDVLLNGTLCSFVSLVLFIAFRSHTEETDSLTGAGSRKAFISELSLRTGGGQAVQIIQFSILNMSDANLRWGHSVGDAILYEVAHYCRNLDWSMGIFRTGNATFTLVLQLENEDIAEKRLQQLIDRMEQDWVLGKVSCKLSVAVAEYRSQNLNGTPSEIIESLEYTLEQAKEEPVLARFDDKVSRQLEERKHILEYMRQSIENKNFYVVYQPVYCCHHDILCSAEALLRLKDDNGKPINPDIFIPLAEEYDLIAELTWIVLEDVCSLLGSNRYPKLEYVTINLSMQQLLDPDLDKHIKGYLNKYHVNPDCLRVEITERFILHDAQYAKEQFNKLQKIGVQIYMDDFGTGYSNLSSVLHFPFTFVKLDRSLITPVVENEQAAIMVRALLKLFKDLGMKVIAEGVENKAQADYLRQIGIDMIQGFYYAKPTPKEELTQYFE